MRKFAAIAFNTAREIARQKAFAALVAASVVTIGIMPVVAVFSLYQEERIVRDGAVAASFLYGIFVVAAAAIASVSRQVRSGAAATVLSKPVGRGLFLAAIYAGILLACAGFSVIAVCSSLVSVRMAVNGILTDWGAGMILAAAATAAFLAAGIASYRGHNFCSALFASLIICLAAAAIAVSFIDPAGRCCHFGRFMTWRLLPTAALVFMALAMLSAIAVALSTRCPPAFVLFFCCFLFIAGLISDYLFFTLAGGSPLALLGSMLVPNWQALGIYEVFEPGAPFGFARFAWACLYAVLYSSAALCLGFVSFRSSEA